MAENTADALLHSIMGNHGAVCVGRTLDEAFAKVAWMEEARQKAYYALLTRENAVERRIPAPCAVQRPLHALRSLQYTALERTRNMIDKNLIVMLTWHDVTVANAKELFLSAAALRRPTGALRSREPHPRAWRS